MMHHDESDSGIAYQHPCLKEIYEGKHDAICSVHDFLTHMPDYGSGKCQEFSRQKNDPLRIFWNPSQTNVHDPNFATRNSVLNLQFTSCELITRQNPFRPGNSTSASALPTSVGGGKLQSVEERMMSFLLSLKYTGSDCVLVQFWSVNRTSSGRIVVSLSEQPFAMSKLYMGFCRYRYYCVHRAKCGYDISELGPLGRVIIQGSPEYCCDIDSYSIKDFPKRNYAKFCGIKDYLALPIFELGHGDQQQERQCIGVLEFLSWYSPILLYSDIMTSLQCSDFNLTSSHFQECIKVRENVLKSKLDARLLDFVRTEHKSPLIHVWVPCICETASRVPQLFCQLSSIDREMIYLWDYQCLILSSGTHSVNVGKGLAGRAYSMKKSCFSMNASQFSISDYPLVHFTRLNGLNACFAILLESINPRLHPLILEVFLLPQQNYDGNVMDVLKSLLSTLSKAFSMHSFAFALTEDLDFRVEFAHLDDQNVVYFDVCRSSRAMTSTASAAIGNGREDHYFHSLQDHELDSALVEPSQTFDATSKGQEVVVAPENRSRSPEMLTSNSREKKQFPSPDRAPEAFEASDHSNNVREDEAGTSRETCRNIDEVEITLEVINRYRGCTKLTDAAKKLGVSRATLKRRCRKFGIKRWPYHRRKEVHLIQSSARLHKTEFVHVGKVIEDHKIVPNNNAGENEASSAKGKSIASGRDEFINQKYSLMVKATYRDDTAKFGFCCNSGIEKLQKEVQKRFKVEVERFKIKYLDDDGEWIILSCNEDLRSHIQAVKASGQSTMKLSVFPVSF